MMSNCSLCKKEAKIYYPDRKCLNCLNNGGVCKRCGRERIIRYKAKGWCVSCYQSVWESDKRKAVKNGLELGVKLAFEYMEENGIPEMKPIGKPNFTEEELAKAKLGGDLMRWKMP